MVVLKSILEKKKATHSRFQALQTFAFLSLQIHHFPLYSHCSLTCLPHNEEELHKAWPHMTAIISARGLIKSGQKQDYTDTIPCIHQLHLVQILYLYPFPCTNSILTTTIRATLAVVKTLALNLKSNLASMMLILIVKYYRTSIVRDYQVASA